MKRLAFLCLLLSATVIAQRPAAPYSQFIAGGSLTGTAMTVTITNPTSADTYDVGTTDSMTVGGTAQHDPGVASCLWTNLVPGGGIDQGTVTGTTSWTTSTIDLGIGVNGITVTCTGATGTVSNDTLAVTRSSGAVTNPIVASRQAGGSTAVPNAYWAAAGATIPASIAQCGSTLASSSTSAQINTAITSCSSATTRYVELGAGTFSLTGAINMKNGVELRGQGMSTNLNFTGNSGATWYWASSGVVTFQGSYAGAGGDNAPPIASAPAGTERTWTGTGGSAGVYTQGATVLNLGSTPTGLSIGDTIILWQNNVAAGSLPNAGFFFSAKTGASNAISWQGAYNDHDASMEQRSTVTAINGTAVTITPGLVHPTGTWITGQSPRIRWLTAGTTLHDAGLRNLRITTTSMAAHQCDICIAFADDIWIKGVGLVPRFTSFHAGGAVDFGIVINDSHHVTVRDSWINTMRGGGQSTTTSYGIALQEAHHVLIENNIFNNVESPTEILVGAMGNVIGYNYERYVGDDGQEGGIQQHEVSAGMNLIEGNSYQKLFADEFHGNSLLTTFYRNHFFAGGADLWSYHRWFNFLGNAMNCGTAYQGLASDAMKYSRFVGVCFRLGYPQQNADSSTTNGVALDSVVWTGLFRWGNYTAVDNMTRFLSAEVPTASPVFPQTVPASQVLPPSLYKSAKPSFFAVSKPWPLMGPDVTGGPFLGGRAYRTPAEDCYTAAGGAIASFAPLTCYGS